MVKIPKILILLLVVGGVFSFGLFEVTFQSSAQGAKPTEENKKLPQLTDKDKNKIFDNLEELLIDQPDEAVFDTIVLFEEALSDTLFENVKSKIGDFSIKYQYSSISGIATTLNKGQITTLSKISSVKQIEHDVLVFPHLDTSQQWFGTTKARTDFGVDGNADGSATYSKDDVVIAVIDTGIDPNHVDLGPNKIIGWRDATINNDQSGPYDELGDCVGHGTHVSSIAAGEGDGDATLKGVAPGSALVGIKVLSLRKIKGKFVCTAETSEIVSGVQWMIDNKATYGIDVANMSLGASGCSDGTGSLSTIVNAAVDAGIVMTVSAGNEGPGPCTIGDPAAANKAITVGVMADVFPGASVLNVCGDNDLPNAGFYLACFSSRGLTADSRIKPDIASPGIFIRAASAGTTNGYKNLSGTSMASPFTAGIAALILDAHPAHTPAQVKSTIESTALDWGPAGKDVDYGSGRLQGYDAVKAAGSFTGTGPAVPSHSSTSDSLSGGNTEDFWNIHVTDISLPVAITMVMPDWIRTSPVSATPDFDMELRDPSGTVIARSISATRQETIGVLPATTGTYQLRVYVYSGSGPYFFDVSVSTAPAVSISLDTDGLVEFGTVALGTTVDSSSDVQTISVNTGPVNLDVKSTFFSDGSNTWSLGSTNGVNQVKWEFSSTTSAWSTFVTDGALYDLANNVAQANTQDLYLRLTMPTDSSSSLQHGATVTIVATAP